MNHSWAISSSVQHNPHQTEVVPVEGQFGIPWDVIDDLLAGPAHLMRVALRVIVYARDAERQTVTVADAARHAKTTKLSILEAASQIPAVLRQSTDGRKLTMSLEPDPFTLSPREKARLAKERREEEKRAEIEKARETRDDEDTQFNRLRLRLEALGLSRAEARKDLSFLIRTYSWDATIGGIEVAEQNKPGSVKAYIVGAIRKGARAGQATSKPRHMEAIAPPRPGEPTILCGWEDRLRDGLRHKLYRQPSGHLIRQAPKAGEEVPTLAADPGITVDY